MNATRAAIGIGSNLGDRNAHVEAAFARLGAMRHSRLVARSSVIETDPVGPEGQQQYLNAAAVVVTRLEPRQLLDAMLDIERERGRDRSREERWGPRTLDLDLLLYGDRIIDEPGLRVPHPRLAERDFVLRPLAEIAPEMVEPVTRKTIRELLDRLIANQTTIRVSDQ